MHAHAHTLTLANTHTPASTMTIAVRSVVAPNHGLRHGWATPFRRWPDNAGRWPFIKRRAGDPISPRFLKFFAYKKMLGRTET